MRVLAPGKKATQIFVLSAPSEISVENPYVYAINIHNGFI